MTSRASWIAAVVLAAGLAGCGFDAPTEWQKPGATSATTATDVGQCRAGAQQRAARLYPQSSGSPAQSGAGMVAVQQQAYGDRSIAEVEMFNSCMQGRGYTREPKPAS
jgi:uncharacterized lipoprotein